MNLEHGIHSACFREIDHARVLTGLGRGVQTRPIMKRISGCHDRCNCPHTDSCVKITAPPSAMAIAGASVMRAATDTATTARRALKDVQAGHMGDLLEYWQGIRYSGERLPTVKDICPGRLRDIAGDNYHILRKSQSGSYKIVRFAPALAADIKADWSGLVLREHPSPEYAKAMHRDFCEADMLGSPVHEEVKAAYGMRSRHYHRLILPLMGDQNRPAFLVGVDFKSAGIPHHLH